MKGSEKIEDAARTVEWLRLELDRGQRELEGCRVRLGELEQAETLLAGENRLLEMVAKGESLPSILDRICRLVEETSSGCLCSILLLDPNDNRLSHGAAPSLPDSYSSAFRGRPIGPKTGPCGRATYFREPVIVCDIAADPLGDDYRDLALAHGLRACWSTPILSSEGKALGSFAVLSREPRSPTPQHQRMIAQITHLAAVAIEHKRTESSLQESEERFRRMAEAIPEVIWFTALQPEKVLYVSPGFERIWGLKAEDIYANPRLWTEAIHPDDRERVNSTFERWIAGEKIDYHDLEYRIVKPNGVVRWIYERGVLTLNQGGKPSLASGISTDITERKRAESLVAGEKRLLEMVARGDALAPILEALCRLGEELSEGALVSILLVSADGKSLRHGAAPSLPKRYTEAIDGGLIGPRAGSCGTAAYRKEPVIVSDIGTDPLWADYRHLALVEGLRACWSTPIFSTKREVLGTFALYCREPGSPTPEQHSVVEQFVHLASIAIERAQAQEALCRSEAYLAEAQRLSLTGSFSWSVVTGELVWSDETFSILGFDRAMKPTLELVLQRVHPEDIRLVQQTIDRATRDETAFDFEHRLLMPDGALKHVHVVARAAKSEAGVVEFVGAVMDITERKKTQDALHAAKARFEGILEIAEDAIISVDSNQRMILFNQGAEKVFGYGQREVIGKPLDVLLPQRFASAHRQHLEEFARSPDVARAMGQRREVFGRRKDGREFPAEASISKLDLGGELVFTVILRDITERKQAAEALRASEKLARSQVEALTRTLDALAMESAPDRLVEHVLRTITKQLGAHSSSVWQRDAGSGLIDFQFSFEDGKFVTKSDSVLAGISLKLPMEEFWPWPAVFRTGKPGLMEDIRDLPFFPWQERLISLGVITILIVPMSIAGRVDAVIGVRFTQKRVFSADELELAQALANQAMLAMQLTRLSGESRESAVIAERNRMARDIHDTLAQGFTGVIVQLEAAADAKSQGLAKEEEEHLGRAGDLARESLREARRSVRALRPQALQQKNLYEALDDLTRRMTEGTPTRAHFQLQGEPRPLTGEWEENLLRIGQEVLTNALRHAGATEFKAHLVFDPEEFRLEFLDNGRGFDATGRHDGFGLLGIGERVRGMGGKLNIKSATGKGTAILIVLPLVKPA